METVETVPIVSFDDEKESEEVTVFIELDKPTEDELLSLYLVYLEGGGEPYEPYASMLAARTEADKLAATASTSAGDQDDSADRLTAE